MDSLKQLGTAMLCYKQLLKYTDGKTIFLWLGMGRGFQESTYNGFALIREEAEISKYFSFSLLR